MNHEEIEALGFTGRLESLRKIKRWEKFSPAFYRHDLEMHTLEVLYLFEELENIITCLYPNLDIKRAKTTILVHDDPETVSEKGDIPYSTKLNMTPKELENLAKEEEESRRKLLSKYPHRINGFDYEFLLEEAEGKQTTLSQLLSYIDKFSAFCESLHELHAGNIGFHEGWQTERARPPVAGTNIADLIPRYTLIREFTSKRISINPPYTKPNVPHLLKTGTPFTEESIYKPTGIPHYDFWKETILKHNKTQGLVWLTHQREFL